MKSSLNVAVVGYGLAGATFHAPLICATEGLTVSHIVTRSAEKQFLARDKFPDAQIVDDFDLLLSKSSSIDLIVIATPNKDHAPQAMAALGAGIATVVDKPIALSSSECELLIDCARKNNAPLSVFQNRRWDNDFLTVKQLIQNGSLGKILRFESRYERYRPTPKANAWREKISVEEGGGILFDLGSHLIDQAIQLFGKPEQVYAEMNMRREGIASDDDSFVALSFPSGVRAHLWMSALSASLGHRFRVLGSEGAYEKYGLDPQEAALRAGGSPRNAGWGEEPTACWGKLTQYRNGLHVVGNVETLPGAYQRFYEIMREAVKGLCGVPVDPQGALQTIKTIEAARNSAQSKSPVTV